MLDRPTVNWEAPLVVRLDHRARHRVSVRRAPLRRLVSLWRSIGDLVYGAFLPIQESMS